MNTKNQTTHSRIRAMVVVGGVGNADNKSGYTKHRSGPNQ